MMEEIKKHQVAYIVLVLAMIALIIGFFIVWPNRVLQRILIVAMMIFYFFWGVITHLQDEYISIKIIIEYIIVSLLAGGLIFLITL